MIVQTTAAAARKQTINSRDPRCIWRRYNAPRDALCDHPENRPRERTRPRIPNTMLIVDPACTDRPAALHHIEGPKLIDQWQSHMTQPQSQASSAITPIGRRCGRGAGSSSLRCRRNRSAADTGWRLQIPSPDRPWSARQDETARYAPRLLPTNGSTTTSENADYAGGQRITRIANRGLAISWPRKPVCQHLGHLNSEVTPPAPAQPSAIWIFH